MKEVNIYTTAGLMSISKRAALSHPIWTHNLGDCEVRSLTHSRADTFSIRPLCMFVSTSIGGFKAVALGHVFCLCKAQLFSFQRWQKSHLTSKEVNLNILGMDLPGHLSSARADGSGRWRFRRCCRSKARRCARRRWLSGRSNPPNRFEGCQ